MSRKLRLEALENRELLAADVLTGAAVYDASSSDIVDDSQLADVAIPLELAAESVDQTILTDAPEIAAAGTTWTVTLKTDTTRSGTLRYALANAEAGDTIVFDSKLKGKTILLSGQQLEATKGVTIDASALYDATTNTPGITLDADDTSRIISVSGGTTSTPVKFIGVAFTNGYGEDVNGGAVYSTGTVEFDKCVFTNNDAVKKNTDVSGGAIYQASGAVTITNSTFSSNVTDCSGGAIYKASGTLTISDTTFTSNIATRYSGGAIYSAGGALSLTNVDFSKDTSETNGGAVYHCDGTLTITECDFTENTSGSEGGAVYMGTDQALTVADSNFIKNTAGSNGGVFYKIYGSITIGGSSFEQNTSGGAGGVIYQWKNDASYTQTMTINDSSFVQNSSTGDGGVIYQYSRWYSTWDWVGYLQSSLTITGSIFDSNKSTNGNGGVLRQGCYLGSDMSALNISSSEFTNNSGVRGGVFRILGYANIENSSFSRNSSTSCGGVGEIYYNQVSKTYANSNVTNTTFTENTAGTCGSGGGGALHYNCANYGLTLTDCNITKNTATHGGGIEGYNCALTVIRGSISENVSSSGGGAISNDSSRIVNLTNVTIADNKAAGNGGAIYNASGDNSTINIVNSKLTGNESGAKGGAIYNGRYLNVSSSLIADNVSTDAGGGIYNDGQAHGTGAKSVLTNVTIANNVGSAGGGIYNNKDEYSVVNVYNSIVYLNKSKTDDGEVENDITQEGGKSGGTIYGYYTLSSYDEWSKGGGTDYEYDASLPLFINAKNGNYDLAKDSQAIDAGNDMYELPSDLDIAGRPRSAGEAIDIGAYEYQGTSGDARDDDYEPNDSRGAASDLGTISTTKTISKLVAGYYQNRDWYKFTISEDGTSDSYVELKYTHVADKADVNLYLYNASGMQIGESKEATGTEKISLVDLAAGTYYIQAYNACNVSNAVDYTLTIAPPAPGASVDLAFYQPSGWKDSVVVSTTSSATSSKTTYSQLQNVYARFAFNSTEAISGTFVQELYLDGKLKKSWTVDGSKTDVVSGVNYTYALGKLAAGDHTITIKLDAKNAIDEADETNNERTITITVLPDDKYEPNDTLKTATDVGKLESAQTYTDLIAGMNSNPDWYKFTLTSAGTAGSYVEANYTHVTGRDDVNLYLYSASGKLLAKSKLATGTERISLKGYAAGTYYVKAYNYTSVDNNVDYSLTFVAPSAPDLAFHTPSGWDDSVVVSTTSSATTSRTTFLPIQKVYVRFAFNSDQAIDRSFTQRLYLDGNLIKSSTVDGTKTDVVSGVDYTCSFGTLAVGEHTITIKLDAKNAIDESDETNNERSVTITVLPDDRYEPNDTLKTAANLGEIKTPQTYTNLIAGAYRNMDYYKFTLVNKGTADSYVEAIYAHVAGKDDVATYLYNASGKQLAKSNLKTGTERISLDGYAAGTYYVKIYNYQNVDHNVDYTLTIMPPATEDLAFYTPGGWSDSAFVANSTTAKKGRTTFSTSENVSVRFAFNASEALDETFVSEVCLDGKSVKTYEVCGDSDDVSGGLDFTYTFGKLAVGEHTISVKLDSANDVREKDETNNERSFTITVLESKDDAFESNDSRAKATDLGTLESTQTYSNLVAGMFGNLDWYKFTLKDAAPSDSAVELTYAHDAKTADVNLYLYNAKGAVIAKSTDATGAEKISLDGLAAGTYYIKAYNAKNVSTDVAYSLTILPVGATDLAFYKPGGWSDSVVASNSSATKARTTFSTSENVSVYYAFKSTDLIDENIVQEIYLDGKLVTSSEIDALEYDVAEGVDEAYALGKLSAGKHTVTVKLDATNAVGESNESNNAQTITITVLESKDDKYESNDTRATATNLGTITSTKTYSNLVAGMFANQDWYKFTLSSVGTSDSAVELTYAHNAKTADVNLYLYNASGKLVGKSTGATGAEKISLEGLAKGTYYVKAYNAKSVASDVSYSLAITPQKAASATSAEAELFRSAFEDDFVDELFDF